MKIPLPRDFFAPVRLSVEEAAQLRLVEAKLLEAYTARYEECAIERNGAVESSSWTLVRQRDGVRVYKRRRRRPARQSPQLGTRRDEQPQIEHAELPGILVVGSIAGSVEDILYGLAWHSGVERRARAHFTGDGVADAAVLHTLDAPSTLEPFRSLSVKWTLKKAPKASLLVKDRDFCFLASTGVLTTRYGEKVGYELRHSVKFPSCPQFANSSVVRAQLYMCSFFRQLRGDRVEVFHQGSFDAAGGLLNALATKAAVTSLASVATLLDCSFAKKLARAVASSDERARTASITSVQESIDGDSRCGMCLRRLGNAPTRSCAICRHCSVRKEIAAASAFASAPVRARCFCGTCVSKVVRDDALMYAIQDVETQQVAPGDGGSSKWDHDDIDDDELVKSHHTIVLVAPDARTLDVEQLAAASALQKPSTRQSQLSKYGAPLGSSQSLASSMRRSTVSPRRRQATAPDVLLRSDAGQRHWTYSTTALSLRSPQRKDAGVAALVQRAKRQPQVRLPGQSPRRSTSITPRGGAAGRLSSSLTSSVDGNAGSARAQRQRQFFRELYTK